MREKSNLEIRKYEDFYQKIRKKITKWAKKNKLSKKTRGWTGRFVEYLIVFPDFVHLMIKLLLDREIPTRYKTIIVFAMSYLLSPLDVVPDIIPVAGLIDDLLVSVIILNRIINTEDQFVINKIKYHWAGEEDVLEKVQEIMDLANKLVSELPRGILKFMDRGNHTGSGKGHERRGKR